MNYLMIRLIEILCFIVVTNKIGLYNNRVGSSIFGVIQVESIIDFVNEQLSPR